jgi:GTPase Era involved in 16S rRNA processing
VQRREKPDESGAPQNAGKQKQERERCPVNGTDTKNPLHHEAQKTLQPLQTALRQMASLVRESGESGLAEKFGELADKLAKDCLTVAFCGHFSAGKSTLINTLCGAPLLPSSPIPTSANVVTIQGGQPAARVRYRDRDSGVVQDRSISIRELGDFAIDGEGVASISVTYPIPLLGDHMAIVDTPGVDSTDGAHRAATESALHLADVVCYVTDYNHVLADVNFRFLRSLAEWGKPTYVIVNQIDKHRESEVPFHQFRKGICEAFAEWGIAPAGLLFLSLRQPDHPYSQWEELLSILQRLQPIRSELSIRAVDRSARFLADSYRATLHARNREERERLLAVLGEEDEMAAIETLASERMRLTAELERVRNARDTDRQTLAAALDKLLANANLTPAELREKASAVLASMQPGFKIGWFSSAAKTEAERERRLNMLAEDFNRQVAANLNGHVRDLLRQEARAAGWTGADMESSLEAAFAPVTPEWLRSKVKPGMGADGQATLHYAAEVAADIRAQYRKQALIWWEQVDALRAPQREAEANRLTAALAALAEREAAAAALAALSGAEQEALHRLLAHLPDGLAELEVSLPTPQSVEVPESTTGHIGTGEAKEASLVSIAAEERRTGDHGGPSAEIAATSFPLGAPSGIVEQLERAAELLKPIPALAGAARDLSSRAMRLRDRQFTIALFGAFSAGKSSFANALVGRPALPVSPNPTTATINRIVAPTEQIPDGQAWITMKPVEAMLADIRHSLTRLGVPAAEIAQAGESHEQLLAIAQRMKAEDVHPRGKPHLAFLRAAAAGWATFGPQLGTSFVADGDMYRRYAADERASCFVSQIDLAVDSPLTRSGAVLVDTPGADSINARHTGVAFEYIKNADAVLFVTYYNHAFTEADRMFLNQLGSVKDVFELDKMFFLINAADLAANDQERKAVMDHVAAQLLKHGIRNPRLLAVSSLNGLQARSNGDRAGWEASGMAAFEAAFREFAASELGELAAASSRNALERADRQLQSWLQAASADEASREAEARKRLEQAQLWRKRATDDVPAAVVQPLRQEIEAQLYHLRQRVYYRFGEHFQASFHPSVLQDDGRDLKKLLVACGDDLQRLVAEDLQQELRAASLRIETAFRRQLESQLADAAESLIRDGFTTPAFTETALSLPTDEPFPSGGWIDARKLWQAFKSPKHFFENEGKKALQEQAAVALFQVADGWLAEMQSRWLDIVNDTYSQALQEAYVHWANELSAYAQSLGESLRQPERAAALARLREQWQQLMAEKMTVNR